MSDKAVILIVDDEKNTREGLARALRDDYYVAEAENGLRALEWLETNHADVVLSDLRMPGMDGMALLSRLLAREPKPVLILLTALSIWSLQELCSFVAPRSWWERSRSCSTERTTDAAPFPCSWIALFISCVMSTAG